MFSWTVAFINTHFLKAHPQEPMGESQRLFSLNQKVESLGIEMVLELLFVGLVELLVEDQAALAAGRMVLVVRMGLVELDRH